MCVCVCVKEEGGINGKERNTKVSDLEEWQIREHYRSTKAFNIFYLSLSLYLFNRMWLHERETVWMRDRVNDLHIQIAVLARTHVPLYCKKKQKVSYYAGSSRTRSGERSKNREEEGRG